MHPTRMYSSGSHNVERALRERRRRAVQSSALQADRVVGVFLVSILLAMTFGAVVGVGMGRMMFSGLVSR